MDNKLNRRVFLELSGKSILGTGASISGIEKIVEQFSTTATINSTQSKGGNNAKSASSVLSLPNGGGAVQGIGEKFQVNAFTGTANFSIPIYTSPGRNGFGPELNLQYSTGNGNGVFGMGWDFSIPKVTRKTNKGIPTYEDDKDVFILSGAEDLVPLMVDGQRYSRTEILDNTEYLVYRYLPRTEGLFARIEFWRNTKIDKPATQSFWKITTKENITSIYGLKETSQLRNSETIGAKIFEWMLELTYDAKGNYIYYNYKEDKAKDVRSDEEGLPMYESHRFQNEKVFQLYLESIRYGNDIPLDSSKFQKVIDAIESDFESNNDFFVVLFDYDFSSENHRINKEYEIRDENDNIKYIDFYENKILKPNWSLRDDRFSFYRAGFEIRTFRKCQRVLMFHNIDNKKELVRSTDFDYKENVFNGISMLTKVTQRGYRRVENNQPQIHFSEEKYINELSGKDIGIYVQSDIYAIKSFPPLEFGYTSFTPDQQHFQTITAEGNDMPPSALNDPNYTLVDLKGTGLLDVLYTSEYGYYYWKNQGNYKFSRRRQLKNMPSGIQLEMTGVGFGDLAGNGQADLLVHQGPQWGYFQTNGKGGWDNFKPYSSYPTFSLNDSSIRLLDLTGDGKSDVLRTDTNSFVWFPAEEEKGFGLPKYIRRKNDLEKFPNVDFSNPRVKLADMTGDGLNDIVLVHNGRIDYWANMGNGNFSPRITLVNAPHFGANFDPNRLYLVDIDGSGNADLLYVESGKLRFWFNQSGNIWSDGYEINGTPAVTDLDAIEVADILGNGSVGVLWTQNYQGAGRSNYMYLDFSGGIKPNLLNEMRNNMGSTTRTQYKPSTYFYRKDEENNHALNWVSTLPFPVQVLEKVEKVDHISKTKLVTTYVYHHGFYDGKEREFRGFAFVEQKDTEFFNIFKEENLHDVPDLRNIKKEYHMPPVLTKTWFHTGVYLDSNLKDELEKMRINSNSLNKDIDIHNLFKADYWQEDEQAFDLPNTVFSFEDGDFDISSLSEAYRVLRGQVLRQEIFALDAKEEDVESKARQAQPFTVSESNFTVKKIQSKYNNKHAVYFVHPNESLNYHYEREPSDPRIVQELTLEVNKYGNVLKSVNIAYPRRGSGHEVEQMQLHTTLVEQEYAHSNEKELTFYYTGVPYQSKNFELVNFVWQGGKIERSQILATLTVLGSDFKEFQEREASGTYKRLLSWSKSYFKQDKNADCTEINQVILPVLGLCPERIYACRLPLGEIDRQLLPYESYQAAFSEAQIQEVFPMVTLPNLEERLVCAGYVKMDNHWWIPSGQQKYDVSKFYLPFESTDPFGNISKIEYDDISLLMKKVTDALENDILATNDYVTLQPKSIIDPNGNMSKVRFDALGLVSASGVMGKLDTNDNLMSNEEGDPLINFSPHWSYEEVVALIDKPYEGIDLGVTKAIDYLQDASVVMVYDLWKYIREVEPPVIYSIVREEHYSKNSNSLIQRKLVYFDGLGREVQTKIETEPTSNGAPRWIVSGWKIYNNKGKPVQQFEPFYTETSDFEDVHDRAIQGEYGVSPTIFYDPLERIVATVHPDGSFEKVEFYAWKQVTYDKNDMVDWLPQNQAIIAGWWRGHKPFLENGLPNPNHFSTWKKQVEEDGNDAQKAALRKAQIHKKTPVVAHLDSLGRPFLTIAENIGTTDEESFFKTHIELDIQGNNLSITDPTGLKCFNHKFNMLQQQLVVDSKDAGVKRLLQAVDGQPIWSQDARGTITEPKYDELRRPIESWIIPMGNELAKFLAVKTLYDKDETINESKESAQGRNAIGQIIRLEDQSGVIENTAFDFKGNIKASERKLWEQYKGNINLMNVNTVLKKNNKDRIFSVSSDFDALNRVKQSVAPDGSFFTPLYNKTNQLKSLSVNLTSNSLATSFVKNIDYNARGQRTRIQYGSGVTTTYKYSSNTFRLEKLNSTNTNNNTALQRLSYTYDPVGNITKLRDDAFKTVFNANEIIEPESNYTYDALYRLITATGRQHVSYHGGEYMNKQKQTTLINFRGELLASQNNQQRLTTYVQSYHYDKSGNILEIKHRPINSSAVAWTRTNTYDTRESNRIINTYKSDTNCYHDIEITHDENGNITRMPHLKNIKWNYANQMHQVELNSGDNHYAYYNYGSDGMRSRKVIERDNTIYTQRLYLQGYEIFIDGTEEKGSLHIMDATNRIALVEKESTPPKIKYQLTNHLGSATLDTNEIGKHLNYEEYTPYGGSAFIAFTSNDIGNNTGSAEQKRYRYSGKERDDETGLYYYGARYYVPWIGQWIKADPTGKKDGLNLFVFTRNNPSNFVDLIGETTKESSSSTLKTDDVEIYKKTRGRLREGQKLEGDHIIAQEKIKMMGNPEYKPGDDPVVMQETGKAKNGKPAKPHTLKTYHDFQADVKEIKRLKANGGYNSFKGDIVEPSIDAAIRSGYKPEAVHKAASGQLANISSIDGTMADVGKKIRASSDDVDKAIDTLDKAFDTIESPSVDLKGLAKQAGVIGGFLSILLFTKTAKADGLESAIIDTVIENIPLIGDLHGGGLNSSESERLEKNRVLSNMVSEDIPTPSEEQKLSTQPDRISEIKQIAKSQLGYIPGWLNFVN